MHYSIPMNLFNRLFKERNPQLEDQYSVAITEETVSVYHPKWSNESVHWKDVHTILLINTDEGPWLPDVWLTLIDNNGKCMIPQGANGFEKVYNIVSKYDGFDFENAIKSMSCTDKAEFLLCTNNN
jgi:hypothetical protein